MQCAHKNSVQVKHLVRLLYNAIYACILWFSLGFLRLFLRIFFTHYYYEHWAPSTSQLAIAIGNNSKINVSKQQKK